MTCMYPPPQSAHKVCSVELLKCELPAEGGRFNLMVELAGMYPPPHMTCMHPPPYITCMYPPPHDAY